MSEFGADPPAEAVEEERTIWSETRDTRGRVQSAAVSLREPTTARAVAERVDCAPNTARKHLDSLAGLGVVRRQEEAGTVRYVRNESYLQWRHADSLASTHSVDELLDALADLEAREESFQARFDAPTPEAVDIPEDASHADIESRLGSLAEWATVREGIARHREAIRIARQDSSRLTA